MSREQRLSVDGLKPQFETLALSELSKGALPPLPPQASNNNSDDNDSVKSLFTLVEDSETERLSIIDKVYTHVVNLARHSDNQITTESITMVIKKLPNDQSGPLHRLVLNLLLFFIEKQTGIRAPDLGASITLKQPLPTLTPDTFLNSELSDALYQLIESKSALTAYLESPEKHVAYLCLWLILKEGITDHVIAPN
ncbi:hypothetical protein HGP28_14950 [Vibrio sp. SM6]|uniref:Uncharacterized protein n=1 Tax=Vibrio agarilyticus TaxID=2726741 RepID=A0A7X8TSQ2_9VIBR|nr:hypothetical protein [Vibrio agarilyticus]NLS14187.1 hypothetical protein [Vibrio agarilyticus]